ncbi:TraR/DksA C4-type zinc finger protein [Marinobacter sp. X15-166B]|uniref:TraR/DksA C4-type zinc finger protein n=1 Tax=Marinobacter sp. X15-166B TaxID=1897620 RepID=UPI00085BDA64|nr:hypothetical protein BG841_14030 [Marinobacter sp. X15-166B]
MADIADTAGDHIEKELEMVLANHRNRQLAPASSDPYCEECDNEIPAARRAALPGCANCVDCQQMIEHQKRTRGI